MRGLILGVNTYSACLEDICGVESVLTNMED